MTENSLDLLSMNSNNFFEQTKNDVNIFTNKFTKVDELILELNKT